MYKLDSQPQLDAPMARSHLTMVLETARRSRHWFLVYLIGGIALYFVYGLWNSKLGKGIVVRGHEERPQAAHPPPVSD